MTRQEAFERSYAESHDLPIETFSQYRMGDTYRLPGIASHWRTWCAALDSVVVEFPHRWSNQDGDWFEDEFGDSLDYGEVISILEDAGLKVAE